MAELRLAPDYTEFLQLYYKYPQNGGPWAGRYQPVTSPLTEPFLISRDSFLQWNELPPSPPDEIGSTSARIQTPQRTLQDGHTVGSEMGVDGTSPSSSTDVREVEHEVDAPVKFVQGKVSTAVCDPKLEHTNRRMAVEAEIATTMDDVPFSLKCQIYRTEMQLIVKEQQKLNARTHVPALKSPPVLVLNSYERTMLAAAGPLDQMPASFARTSSIYRGRSNEDILQEVLNSLTNRILFLVMIEYRSWFPQDRARSQIVRCVLKALDSKPLPAAVGAYVANFVVQRTKNFRDVISRVCKRDKSHRRASAKSSAELTS